MGQSILQHGGRFVLWSSIVDAPVTAPMSEAELRVVCANERWDGYALNEAIARALKTGISSRMVPSLDSLVEGRIGLVENENADLDEGEEPLPVPTREDLISKWFAEDGHREATVHPTDDGLDLIVRTADRDGGNVRDVVLGLRFGEIAIVAKEGETAQGLAMDAAGIDALIHALTRLRPAVIQGEDLRQTFLQMVDNDIHARIESDVDGCRGTFGMIDGAVVRFHGDLAQPFAGTLDDLRKISEDGAYEITRGA